MEPSAPLFPIHSDLQCYFYLRDGPVPRPLLSHAFPQHLRTSSGLSISHGILWGFLEPGRDGERRWAPCLSAKGQGWRGRSKVSPLGREGRWPITT